MTRVADVARSLFANAAAADYHQPWGSPMVDRGTVDSPAGLACPPVSQ